LVGPIRDEDDLPEPAPVRQDDGSWVVPARWRIDEVADATGLKLPEDPEYDTLSGLVLSRLGRVPEPGDAVLAGDLSLTVLTVERHVPGTVLISLHRPDGTLPQ
jgi:CBS domain containing-hemolysin-like protein